MPAQQRSRPSKNRSNSQSKRPHLQPIFFHLPFHDPSSSLPSRPTAFPSLFFLLLPIPSFPSFFFSRFLGLVRSLVASPPPRVPPPVWRNRVSKNDRTVTRPPDGEKRKKRKKADRSPGRVSARGNVEIRHVRGRRFLVSESSLCLHPACKQIDARAPRVPPLRIAFDAIYTEIFPVDPFPVCVPAVAFSAASRRTQPSFPQRSAGAG